MNNRINGFPPILGPDPRVLVLGTMPSVESLRTGRYYGHPRNHFWPLIYRVLEGGPPPQSYTERCEFLINRGIAVWDVFENCEREGSLDQNIKEEAFRDIGALLEEYPSIELVALNGTKAEKGFKQGLKHYGRINRNKTEGPDETSLEKTIKQRLKEVTVQRLPSTSPVPSQKYRRMEDKVDAWSIVACYARNKGAASRLKQQLGGKFSKGSSQDSQKNSRGGTA